MLAHQPRRELGSYELPNGELRIVGQRIVGHVAVGDIPAHEEGRVFRVERHLESSAALDGLVAAPTSLTHRSVESPSWFLIAERNPHDPRLSFVIGMCLYAHLVAAGDAPYFARTGVRAHARSRVRDAFRTLR